MERIQEFLDKANHHGWLLVCSPQSEHSGRTEVKRRCGRRMVYVSIETDSLGRVTKSSLSFGADRIDARSAHCDSRETALEWLGYYGVFGVPRTDRVKT